MPERVLVISDDEGLCAVITRFFSQEGCSVDSASHAETALKMIYENPYDLILCRDVLPSADPFALISDIKRRYPAVIVIVVTDSASLDGAVKALRVGAYDYLITPVMHDEIRRLLRDVSSRRETGQRSLEYQTRTGEGCDFGKIIGKSDALLSVLDELAKISNALSNVLLLGETGTGKELFAKAIHSCSARREKPFVPINCSAIPENLLESELFGYVKGAFTGANSSKRGLFEEAHGGTLFLDEIGDLGQLLQTKLLRVLDDREIRPIGSTQSRKVDVRFIAATNRNLMEAVRDGRFREDLFFRINVVTLRLPPLRDRQGDVSILAGHFLEKFSYEIGKHVHRIDERALRLLEIYSWPGNIRELRNIMERAVLLADGETIRAEHLPEELRAGDTAEERPTGFTGSLSIEEYTKHFIVAHQSRFSEQKIAEMLGITRKALWEKRKRWGLRKE